MARRRLPGGAVGSTLWLASLILGVALITGAVGGTGARAANGSRVQQTSQVRNSRPVDLSSVDRRQLPQRLGVAIMYSQ